MEGRREGGGREEGGKKGGEGGGEVGEGAEDGRGIRMNHVPTSLDNAFTLLQASTIYHRQSAQHQQAGYINPLQSAAAKSAGQSAQQFLLMNNDLYYHANYGKEDSPRAGSKKQSAQQSRSHSSVPPPGHNGLSTTTHTMMNSLSHTNSTTDNYRHTRVSSKIPPPMVEREASQPSMLPTVLGKDSTASAAAGMGSAGPGVGTHRRPSGKQAGPPILTKGVENYAGASKQLSRSASKSMLARKLSHGGSADHAGKQGAGGGEGGAARPGIRSGGFVGDLLS